MSPRLLRLLQAHVKGMAIASLPYDDRWVWTYGLRVNPLGPDHLRQFRMLRRAERDY